MGLKYYYFDVTVGACTAGTSKTVIANVAILGIAPSKVIGLAPGVAGGLSTTDSAFILHYINGGVYYRPGVTQQGVIVRGAILYSA